MAPRNQVADVQKLYNDRAERYDDSWHPRFAKHVVELAHLQPGEHILDLACGTGLVTHPASNAVGSKGSVVGIDISSGMLQQARAKYSHHHVQNVELYQHSITDLDSLSELKGRQFDVLICASALTLLEKPGDELSKWVHYLRPGGRLVVDVTHPESQISLITFERVGRRLGRPLPFYRVPFQTAQDLERLMVESCLQDIQIHLMSQMAIDGTDKLHDYISDPNSPRIEHVYNVDDADTMFDKYIDKWIALPLASPPQVKEAAREVFKDEWAKLADSEGHVREVDAVFVGTGRKPI